MKIQKYLEHRRGLVEDALDRYMPPPDGPFARHIEAMRYSLFVGGKRIRPILCLAAGEAVTGTASVHSRLLPVACALECIHTYSLIHDDLPAMDDDSLRRGHPTNHTVYGEAEAILAGDGLLSWAFELLSSTKTKDLTDRQQLRIIHTIAQAIGPQGMVGGQFLDISSENSEVPFSTLQTIHRSKTGALITASVLAGGIGGGADESTLEALTRYGNQLGLAFQIVDDLLNATSTAEELGKAAGSDAERGKATYPAYFGVEQTREMAQKAVQSSIEALRSFSDTAWPLREIAQYVYTRTH